MLPALAITGEIKMNQGKLSFMLGFLFPLILILATLGVVLLMVLPIAIGAWLQGDDFSAWWGVANLIWLMFLSGLSTMSENK